MARPRSRRYYLSWRVGGEGSKQLSGRTSYGEVGLRVYACLIQIELSPVDAASEVRGETAGPRGR